jgi:hypothetical protein
LRGFFQAIEGSQGWLHLSIGRADRWQNWGIVSTYPADQGRTSGAGSALEELMSAIFSGGSMGAISGRDIAVGIPVRVPLATLYISTIWVSEGSRTSSAIHCHRKDR